MTSVVVKTHTTAKIIVTALTLMAGVGIAAAFVEASNELRSRQVNPASRQFVELEKPVVATTTEGDLGRARERRTP